MREKKNTHIRREEIVRAALDVIGERGVHGLTIAEIAGRAGMSDANIYRHFRGKQEILAALGSFIGSQVLGRATRIAAGKKTALARLGAIFRAHVALLAATPGLPRFIFSEELHLGDPRLAAVIAGTMARYIETLGDIVADGCRNGEFSSDISPRETAILLLGMIQFAALRWSISRGAFSLEAEAERLWVNFRRLLVARAARRGLKNRKEGV
ncbi:MAG: TetR/AcrR family transcriptional regulator [Thermodesulfobacteriota bacterium]